jgi:hypothetical protein
MCGTVKLLGEIAEERGIGEHFRSTMPSQGFVPETLLYVMMGRPDRIVVADESLDEMAAEDEAAAARQGREPSPWCRRAPSPASRPLSLG